MDVRTEWRDDHLLAVVEGAFDPKVARQRLALMLQACAEEGLTRILIDARGIATSVSVADRFDLGAHLAARGPPVIRVAILVTPANTFSRSPIAGPILKPWPDPPPAIQTFPAAGCRSMMKCASGVASYWQTSPPTKGAWAKAGKRRARNARTDAMPSAATARSPEVGSNIGPGVSSATLNARPSLPGMP